MTRLISRRELRAGQRVECPARVYSVHNADIQEVDDNNVTTLATLDCGHQVVLGYGHGLYEAAKPVHRPREDRVTNTVEDAALFEQQRGRDEWIDDRPTRAELGED